MKELNLDALNSADIKKLELINTKIATAIQNNNNCGKKFEELENEADNLLQVIKIRLEKDNPNYIFAKNITDEFEQRDSFFCKKKENNALDGEWLLNAICATQTGDFNIHITNGLQYW